MSAEVPACAEVHKRLRDHSCHLTMNWQFKSPANKNNQHPPHLWQLLTFEPAANRLQGTCSHNDVTVEGNFISFDSYSSWFFFFLKSLMGPRWGFSWPLRVTVFVVYTFRSITLEPVWAHSKRRLLLRLGQGWGYKHGVEWWMWKSLHPHQKKHFLYNSVIRYFTYWCHFENKSTQFI